MLIEEFSFGNVRSFKDIQTLRMSAANITSSNKVLDTDNVFRIGDNTNLLKSKLIYGANASGKSNVMKALAVFRGIIKFSLNENIIRILMDTFKFSTETKDAPCFFQMIFYVDHVRYRYGFEASQEKVSAEWLFKKEKKEIAVFIREEQKMVKISKTHLKKGYEIYKGKSKLFTEKVLFLSLAENFSDELAETIVSNIQSILICSNTLSDSEVISDFVNKRLENDHNKKMALTFLKHADISLKDILFYKEKKEDDKESVLRMSTHPVYDENLKEVDTATHMFDYLESEGTKQTLFLSSLMFDSLSEGNPIIIDEFGSKLHPLLTKKLFSLFNSPQNTKSQLIAITHMTELMKPEIVRKDQIDLVEKDKYGRSYLYTLAELKGVKNTAPFEKNYFEGRYGAIPFLGNLSELLEVCNEPNNTSDESK